MLSEIKSTLTNVEGSRVHDACSCFPCNTIQGRDVEQAYLNAELGGPPTHVSLPGELWTPEMFKMKNPVVELEKAIYGHKHPGVYWQDLCDDGT